MNRHYWQEWLLLSYRSTDLSYMTLWPFKIETFACVSFFYEHSILNISARPRECGSFTLDSGDSADDFVPKKKTILTIHHRLSLPICYSLIHDALSHIEPDWECNNRNLRWLFGSGSTLPPYEKNIWWTNLYWWVDKALISHREKPFNK